MVKDIGLQYYLLFILIKSFLSAKIMLEWGQKESGPPY